MGRLNLRQFEKNLKVMPFPTPVAAWRTEPGGGAALAGAIVLMAVCFFCLRFGARR